jgi:Tfp pilus assembly protein PilN
MLIAGFNLASLGYRQSRRRTLLVAAGVAALALVLALQIVLWAGLRRDAEGIGRRLAQMEDQVRRHEEEVRAIRATIPGESLKRYQAKVAAYNQILEASAFSWTRLLVELEHAVPPGVYLREISPDPSTGRVTLNGVARSFDDLARLVRGLADRTTFRDVYLLRQARRTGDGDAQEFGLSLTYQGRPS